jgi:hypothetical protein
MQSKILPPHLHNSDALLFHHFQLITPSKDTNSQTASLGENRHTTGPGVIVTLLRHL